MTNNFTKLAPLQYPTGRSAFTPLHAVMKIEEITSLPGHSSAAWSVAFHPHDPILASCSGDKSIRMYGFTKALEERSFQHICTLPSSHSRTIRQLAFSPDGKRMASASFDSTVGIWERTRSAGGTETAPDSDDDDEETGEEWENVGSLEGMFLRMEKLAKLTR
jgi:WD40 repeat protein